MVSGRDWCSRKRETAAGGGQHTAALKARCVLRVKSSDATTTDLPS